jgi:hypothetical protein
VVRIPKGSGRGTRTLHIRNVQDRVVERSVVQVLQPFLDPGFAPFSFGYRPRLGREHALAYAEAVAERDGLWSWVLDDVRDAFDHVPLGRLLDVVRVRLGTEDIVELVRVVVDGGATCGIPQGCSLSPLLLNLYLDHVLDRPWARRQPATPLIRVADDLLVLARNEDDAHRAHQSLTAQLRAAGLALKATPGSAVRDLLHGDTGDWLGFRLRKGPDGLEVRPTDRCWGQLDEALMLAHTKPAAPVRAYDTIVGWAEQLGPCRPHMDLDDLHARIAVVASRYAFDEVPSRHSVEDAILRGYRRSVALKARARHLLHTAPDPAAPPARV